MHKALCFFGGKVKRDNLKPANFLSRCASEITGVMSLIEIHSDYELILSGCKGIIDYDCSQVIAETISGIVKINGSCLALDVFHGDVLTVSGKINSVCLE